MNELTPNLTSRKNNFINYKKSYNPLKKTREIYQRRNKFEEKELKEFSIFYLIINNLEIFRKNIELVSEINFSSELMESFKQELINYLLSEDFDFNDRTNLEQFNQKSIELINTINSNAPIKIIAINKKEDEIMILFNEVVNEIKKIDLKTKIESLEDEVSLNLDEKLYSQLLSLRNQLKGG